MTDAAISRYPVPTLDELPDDLRQRIEEVAERSGFVPNVFLAMAHRPDELRAFLAYHDALMERDSGLSKAERELIVVVTSAANDCLYCVVAHGAILRIRSKRPMLADQVAVNWRGADLSDRERAICEAATVLAVEPARFGDEHRQRLHQAGLSDEDIWDLGAVTAFFALSNRMAHLTEMRPNDEFYLMGR
jgi:uncharacterized peroxidase-related enzyme